MEPILHQTEVHDLCSAALVFIHERCTDLRFCQEITVREQESGIFEGISVKKGQIPYNMQMDIDGLCLERAIERFMRRGTVQDAFDVYFCYLEMFVCRYGKSRRMIELLSEFETNSSFLLMKHREQLYKRDSSRASSLHTSVKKTVLQTYISSNSDSISSEERDKEQWYEEQWNRYFGKAGLIRIQKNELMFNGTNDELNQRINSDVFLKEMVMMEHRRWCYYTAAKGWKSKYGTYGEKIKEAKINPCLVDWRGLNENLQTKEACKYDLQPLLFILNQERERQTLNKK